MKIIVYGGTNNREYTHAQMSACEKLGKFLGSSNAEILTGACRGYPYYVGKAAIQNGSRHVIGYSPALDLKEHVEVYKFPTDGVTELVYVDRKCDSMPEAFMRRSIDMTPFAEIVVVLGGSWGTFAEIIMSFMYRRTIILVEEFEGAVKAFEDAFEFFGARDTNPAVHNGAKIIRAKTIDDAINELKLLQNA
jgi:predicted Rossmann-fold nucleotide-binding protein